MLNHKAILLSILVLSLLSCDGGKASSKNDVVSEAIQDSGYYLDGSGVEENLITEIEVISYSLTEEDSILKDLYEFQLYELIPERIDSAVYAKSIIKDLGSKMRIQQQSVDEISDSCFVLNYLNGESDTLCDVRRGDYFEKYELIGYYLNGFVIRSSNWEESYLGLRNRLNGDRHVLSPNYSINNRSKLLLDYNSTFKNPLVGDYLSITSLTDSTYVDFALLFLTRLSPLNTYWVNDSSLVARFIDLETENYEVENNIYYSFHLRNKSGK